MAGAFITFLMGRELHVGRPPPWPGQKLGNGAQWCGYDFSGSCALPTLEPAGGLSGALELVLDGPGGIFMPWGSPSCGPLGLAPAGNALEAVSGQADSCPHGLSDQDAHQKKTVQVQLPCLSKATSPFWVLNVETASIPCLPASCIIPFCLPP